MIHSIQNIHPAKNERHSVDLSAGAHELPHQAYLQAPKTSDHFRQAICAAEAPDMIRRLTSEAACNLAPAELKECYESIERNGLRVPLDVFRRIAPLYGELNRHDIQLPDFDNIVLSTHARLFLARNVCGPKALLIIFTGLAGQAGVTYCRVLTRIPAGLDVLFLRRHEDHDYRFGVPGLGMGFFDTCQQIAANPLLGNYQCVGCLGTSMGGLWALRAALVLRANLGVSLSGRFSRRDRALSPYDQEMENDPLLQYQQQTSSRLYCFFGTDAPMDVEDAERFRSMVPRVSMIPLEGFSGHNAMCYLSAKRQLKAFFATLYKGTLDREANLW